MTTRTTAIVSLAAILLAGCSSDDEPDTGSGGSAGASGRSNSGGAVASTTAGRSSGGSPSAGQAGRAGAATTIAIGGSPAAAGTSSVGGSVGGSIGGTNSAVGGASSIAGTSSLSGGAVATGGVASSATNGGAAGTITSGGAATSSFAGSETLGGASSGGSQTAAGSGPIAGATFADSGGTAGTASENGVAGTSPAASAGTAGSNGSTPPRTNCGAVRESVVGWWSFDASLASRSDDGSTLQYGPDTVLPSYVPGVASGQALDFSSHNFPRTNDAKLNVTHALTLSAFVKAVAPDGRIIDRITPGGSDGYLLDFHDAHLRMIIGSRALSTTSSPTSADAFTHVAGVFTGGTSPEIRLYLDGVLADQASVAADAIPSNTLDLLIGADQNGNNVFTGTIDEPMVFARALSGEEVMRLREQLTNGECPVPVANSPAVGSLLEHNEAGEILSGSVEFLHSNIRRVGDLRVLAADALYNCDWNVILNDSVTSCQAWVPFATSTTSDHVAPMVPLEWRLLRFNITGLVDQIGIGIDTGSATLHEQTDSALTWFGRDWRQRRYVTDAAGNALVGSLSALAEQIRGGSGIGVLANNSNNALPHLTAVVPLVGDHFAGQDPWHISADGSNPAGITFQNSPYHYAVWFDTTGYDYASRWYLGSPVSISDTPANEPLTFVTEPGWTEALAHDATGTVTSGSLTTLRTALLGGAALRVGTPEGYFDCNRVVLSDFVGCVRYDSYNPASTGDGHLRFDATHTRSLRYYATDGRALHENWSDHSPDLASRSDDPEALRWFVQPSGWQMALATNASGDVVSGSIADLVTAIQAGAEIAVVSSLGGTAERVNCASLQTATGPTRAACLSLVQTPRELTGNTSNPGYYEARVYNTNGVVASARVAFGSTTTSDEAAPIVSLAWFVRAL